MRNIFGLPLFLVGIYGIINQYALKLAGVLAYKYFKSPLKTMRLTFAGGVIGLILIILYAHLRHPHGFIIAMILTLGMASFIFM